MASLHSRRRFLGGTAGLTAASVAVPAVAHWQKSPNERIRIGLVGLGGRMRAHIACLVELSKTENIEIAALCDCDRRRLESAPKDYPELAGLRYVTYTDQRKLFDDKSIDAVSFSTQDHWHALQTIWACQAGKHVYVEKPPSWCIWEGRKMVEAARKYNRMVQVGTQNRSNPFVREGMQKLREGIIGKLYMARAISYKIRGHLGKHRPSPVPEGLDWDAWVGPAQMVEYSPFMHRRWYWISNFAVGDAANQLVHDVDKVRWGLGLDGPPTTVMAMGGRFPPAEDDDADTPNTLAAICKWEGHNLMVTVENRHWYTNSEARMRDEYPFVSPNQCVGEIFFGTEGYMIFPNYSSYYTFLGPKNEPGPCNFADPLPDWWTESIPHFKNWIEAIRLGDHRHLTADILEGHLSTIICHLINISIRLGRSVHFDPKTETFPNDPEANQFLRRQYRPGYEVPEVV